MSAMASNPFRMTFRYLQRQAHESPAVFYSIVIGLVGPIAVVGVPPIRRRFGYEPAERVPTSFPVPNREREEVSGYDDE